MEQFAQVTNGLASGFATSFALFALTLVMSLPLGMLIALCTGSRIKALSVPFKIIVWVLRGTPLLLQIFAVFYVPGLLFGFAWPMMNTGWAWFDKTFSTRFIATLAAFAVNYAAYFSEIFRGGIDGIAKGQREAGKVLGMTRAQIFFRVILLQVIKNILSPISNEVMTLVKDTSLAQSIGVVELMFAANEQLTRGLIWPIFYAGAFYLVFVGILTLAFGAAERKLKYFKV